MITLTHTDAYCMCVSVVSCSFLDVFKCNTPLALMDRLCLVLQGVPGVWLQTVNGTNIVTFTIRLRIAALWFSGTMTEQSFSGDWTTISVLLRLWSNHHLNTLGKTVDGTCE